MRGMGWGLVLLLSVVANFVVLSTAASAQEGPQERFQSAVILFEEKRIQDARDQFVAILAAYDTSENRSNVEYDLLLAGSLYNLGETYFQEERFEEAAARYEDVIASFRIYRPESYYHLGLSKHYRQDHTGAIATLGELVAQYPGSPLAPQAIYYQATCYELLKDKAEAKTAFQTMIERYPQHAWTKKAREKVKE